MFSESRNICMSLLQKGHWIQNESGYILLKIGGGETLLTPSPLVFIIQNYRLIESFV